MERNPSNRPAPRSARRSSATRLRIGPTLFRSTRIRLLTALRVACTPGQATCHSKSRVYALFLLTHGNTRRSPHAPRTSRARARAPAAASCSRCRGDANGVRPDGRTGGHAPRIWRTGPRRPHTGASGR